MPTRKALRSKKKKELKERNEFRRAMNGVELKVCSEEDFDAVVEWAYTSDRLNAKTLRKSAPSVADALLDRYLGQEYREPFSRRVAVAVMCRRMNGGQMPPKGIFSAFECIRRSPDQMAFLTELGANSKRVDCAVVDLFTKKRCWQCDREAKTPQLCCNCAVATYCGEDCSKKAWKSGGHKQQCSFHKFRWHIFQCQLKFMESMHSFTHRRMSPEVREAIYPVPLNRSVDYSLVEELGLLEYHRKAGMRCPPLGDHDPSMGKFYHNLGRVGRGEWWVCGDPITSPVDFSKRDTFRPEDYEEKELFLFLCVSMMYKEEDAADIGRASANNMFESLCDNDPGCFRRGNETGTSAKPGGIDNVKSLCGGKSSMKASRFLDIYEKIVLQDRTDKDARRQTVARVRLYHYQAHRAENRLLL